MHQSSQVLVNNLAQNRGFSSLYNDTSHGPSPLHDNAGLQNPLPSRRCNLSLPLSHAHHLLSLCLGQEAGSILAALAQERTGLIESLQHGYSPSHKPYSVPSTVLLPQCMCSLSLSLSLSPHTHTHTHTTLPVRYCTVLLQMPLDKSMQVNAIRTHPTKSVGESPQDTVLVVPSTANFQSTFGRPNLDPTIVQHNMQRCLE
jgi:hypothetical protein